MAETLLEELKRYVGFGPADEAALQALHPVMAPRFQEIANVFYARILSHDGARTALEGGESQVGRLKVTLVRWMDELFAGPWDEAYYERRCRIGRVHVRIALPQHYMFGAMNVVRQEVERLLDQSPLAAREQTRLAVGKVLDIELAIMLHTYREDLLAQAERHERLATFGQLVGSIGHELRNPLGVIETSLYILRGRLGEDERAKKHVERIGEQLSLANHIITDLLELIRDKPLRREPVAFGPVVRGAAEAVARPEGVRLQLEGLDGLPLVEGDATQLRQVFVNLLENATHAASPQGFVRVSATAGAAGVELAVEDSGEGVAPAIRKRLFEPLITTKPQGTGLGLALVRRIVERHGGTIQLEPPATAPGARFVLRFPPPAE